MQENSVSRVKMIDKSVCGRFNVLSGGPIGRCPHSSMVGSEWDAGPLYNDTHLLMKGREKQAIE